jgi:hypothetical protein
MSTLPPGKALRASFSASKALLLPVRPPVARAFLLVERARRLVSAVEALGAKGWRTSGASAICSINSFRNSDM